MIEGNGNIKEESKPSLNFIEQFIAEDIRAGKNGGKVVTRFPPSPTDISILVTPRPFVSTLVPPLSSEENATCGSTTPIPQRRMLSMLMPLRKI